MPAPRQRLTLHPLAIPLRHPWRLAHGTRTVQRNLVLALHAGHHVGYGEAAAIPYLGVAADDLAEVVEAQRGRIEAAAWDEPADFWHALDPHLPEPAGRFALSALDAAAHDLWGQRHGRPTRALLARQHPALLDPSRSLPRSNYTLGMADQVEMEAKLRERPRFPSYKVKVGSGDLTADLAALAHVRGTLQDFGSRAALRVDANGGWSARDVADAAATMIELGVELLEQPLPRDAPAAAHAAARAASPVPVIADESCIAPGDVAACAQLFDGINIKLMKCGGLTPALGMIADARARGLTVMAGCMTETTIGISALAQLLPFLDHVDMDGALLLAHDVAEGAHLRGDGVAELPDRAGLGLRASPLLT